MRKYTYEVKVKYSDSAGWHEQTVRVKAFGIAYVEMLAESSIRAEHHLSNLDNVIVDKRSIHRVRH